MGDVESSCLKGPRAAPALGQRNSRSGRRTCGCIDLLRTTDPVAGADCNGREADRRGGRVKRRLDTPHANPRRPGSQCRILEPSIRPSIRFVGQSIGDPMRILAILAVLSFDTVTVEQIQPQIVSALGPLQVSQFKGWQSRG